jgi:hypothetical protein
LAGRYRARWEWFEAHHIEPRRKRAEEPVRYERKLIENEE